MTRTLPLVLLATTVLLAAPAAGATIPDKGSIAVFAAVGPAIPFEGDYDVGFHLEGGGEYYFTKTFAARGTFGVARLGVTGGADATVWAFEASAVYTSRRGDWAPFVLGGFGTHSVDPPGRGPTQKLGAHFGAGTAYFLDRRTALTGQLTGRFIGSAGGRTSSYASATFGIKYHF